LDSSTGTIVYATQADNIIQDVKNKLGIKDAPAAGTPKKN
jgi:hypothetical protein